MRVLVIRTIQSDLLPGLVAKWRKKWPMASVSIYTHEGQHHELEKIFDEVYYYKHRSDFSAWGLNTYYVQSMRDQAFDLAIIPHHQAEIEGFENVLLMLAHFGVKKWAHCGPDGILKPVSKLRVVRAIATGLAALGPASALYAGYLITLLLQERRTWRNS